MQSIPATRILRLPAVVDRIDVHPTTLWRWERAGQFPRRVRLGLNSVGWRESDIDRWIAERAAPGDEAGS